MRKRYAMDAQVPLGSESVASTQGTVHIPGRPDTLRETVCDFKRLSEWREANGVSGVGPTHSSDESRESGRSKGVSGWSSSMQKHN
jgi:hypothetical protein